MPSYPKSTHSSDTMPAATKTATISKTAAPAKPTYSVMVTETLKSLGNRSANSLYVISKELSSKYNIDINKHALSKAIKKGVESGDLIQVKASYKLNKSAAPPKKPAKSTAEPKKAAPASAKPAKKLSAKTSVKKTAKTIKITKKVGAKDSLKPKKTLKKTVKSATKTTGSKRAKVVQTTKVSKTVTASKKATPAK